MSVPDAGGGTAPPRTIRLAAVGLLVRAAFRLPVLVFIGFVVTRHLDLGPRSVQVPDGPFFAWLYYTLYEIDNLLFVPLATLAYSLIGWAGMSGWLVAYSAVTAAFLVVGGFIWRGKRLRRNAYRATLGYLLASVVIHTLALIAIVPGAMGRVEHTAVYPYAYGLLLLPWSVAVAVAAVMVAALLRTDSARSHPVCAHA